MDEAADAPPPPPEAVASPPGGDAPAPAPPPPGGDAPAPAPPPDGDDLEDLDAGALVLFERWQATGDVEHLAACETLCRQTVQARFDLLGLEHPRLWEPLFVLFASVALQGSSRQEAAYEGFQMCLENLNKQVEPSDPRRLFLLAASAGVCMEAGAYDQAGEEFQDILRSESLSLSDEVDGDLLDGAGPSPLGFTRADVENAMTNFSITTHLNGARTKALNWYYTQLEQNNDPSGSAHRTLALQNNLALLLMQDGRYGDAVEMLRDVYTRTCEAAPGGREAPDAVSAGANLALAMALRGLGANQRAPTARSAPSRDTDAEEATALARRAAGVPEPAAGGAVAHATATSAAAADDADEMAPLPIVRREEAARGDNLRGILGMVLLAVDPASEEGDVLLTAAVARLKRIFPDGHRWLHKFREFAQIQAGEGVFGGGGSGDDSDADELAMRQEEMQRIMRAMAEQSLQLGGSGDDDDSDDDEYGEFSAGDEDSSDAGNDESESSSDGEDVS